MKVILQSFDEKTCPNCDKEMLKKLSPLVMYWCSYCGSITSVNLMWFGDIHKIYTYAVPVIVKL